MSPLDDIKAQARANPKRIVMAEGADPRIVQGSLQAVREGLAQITLVGGQQDVEAAIRAQGGKMGEVEIVDPAASPLHGELAQTYFELRRHKGVDEAKAAQIARQPLEFAALMVRGGYGQGTIAGAVATTGDTVRVAFQVIGRAKGASLVSSFFLMILDQPHHQGRGPVLFADCALVIDPSTEELVQIAKASAKSCEVLLKTPPKLAMLSFSTLGSARHERIDKVSQAVSTLRANDPALMIEGELQFDAAFVPEIARSKSPGSQLEGDANVFIFPSLEAANIGYKIAQRIGAATAIGPILQGLAQPANDLSRGCSAQDVYHLIALTSVQAGG